MPEYHVGPRAPTFIEVVHCPKCGTLNRAPELAPSSPEYWALFAVVLDCRSRYRSQVERGRSSAFRVGSVARTCTICSHPKLVSIDRQLLRGDMLNSIAHRFHVSPDAVGRHRRHMRTAMLKAQAAAEKQDLVYDQTLIDEVKAIKADAERVATGSRRPAGHQAPRWRRFVSARGHDCNRQCRFQINVLVR